MAQPFPIEFGETTMPSRHSASPAPNEFDSTSSVDSNTEFQTVVEGGAGYTMRVQEPAGGSRISNYSVSSITTLPSGDNSPATRKRKTPPQSAHSVPSQTSVAEDTNPSADYSNSVVPKFWKSESEFRETVAPPTPKEPEYECEVVCCCKQPQPLTFINNNDFYVVIQGSGNENDILKSYSLYRTTESVQVINRTAVVGHATCKFFYSNKLSLLSGQFDDRAAKWKLRLYQLDIRKASWELVSRYSGLQLDLRNSIPVSCGNDEIILASVLQNQETRQITFSPVIYLFSQSRGGEKWKAVKLRSIRFVNCEIQSCVVVLNYIYFSLLVHGMGFCVYRCGLMVLQRQKATNFIEPISAECSWPIKNLNLQNCFLSEHKERVVVITTSVDCGKIIMQIKPLKVNPTVVSPAQYQFELPCELKIIAASIVPDVQNPEIAVTIVYHNNTTNSCHFKKIKPFRLA